MPPKSQKPSKGAKGDLTNDSVRQPSGKGDKINGKSAAQASNVSACDAAKGPSKMSKQEERALRQQEQDAMLMIPDESSEDEIAAGRSGSDPAKSHVDSFGNTLTKNAVAKAKEDAKMDVLRAEARARREAKAQREAESLVAGSEAPSAGEHVFTKAKTAVTVEDVRLKLASGAKLSHKESKLLQRAESDAIEEAERRREEAEGLSSFSISYHGGGGTVSAVDIVASGLTITAPSKSLLIDASLCLLQGRRYGLMGPNGKGKTTLLKFLAARRLPIPDGIDVLMVQQEVLASEDSVVNQVLAFDVVRARLIAEEQGLLRDFELQETISEPTSMWTTEVWAEKLARYADVGRQLEAMGADAAESSVRRILTGLGFTEEMQDGPSSILSGGWRMRVALASALFLEPKLLCLDEPTNHLDLNAVLWLENYLSSHWEGKTIIVVSHDASFLGEICTDIIHLDACKLNYYKGSYWEFASLHDQIEAKKLRDYNEEQKVVAEIKKSGIRADKIEKRALQKLNKSVLTERPSEYRVSFHLQSPDEQGPAIELRDVSFSFPSTKRTLFSHLTAKIDTYSRVSIVGPNGAGKSSLLRLFTGVLQPTAGDVISHSSIRVGCYHQHFEELLAYDTSPIEHLMSAYGTSESNARKYLGMFGLDGPRHLIKIGDLSGGQKARVVFASLSLQMPHILVLDEPTNHLDMESVEALIQGINNFSGGVVIVSHDARLIEATQCDLWVCDGTGAGMHMERRGFEQYRRDVLRKIQQQSELAASRSAARIAARKSEKDAALLKFKSKRSVLMPTHPR